MESIRESQADVMKVITSMLVYWYAIRFIIHATKF